MEGLSSPPLISNTVPLLASPIHLPASKQQLYWVIYCLLHLEIRAHPEPRRRSLMLTARVVVADSSVSECWSLDLCPNFQDAGILFIPSLSHSSPYPPSRQALTAEQWPPLVVAIIEKRDGWVRRWSDHLWVWVVWWVLRSWAGRSRVMWEPDSRPWGAVNTS